MKKACIKNREERDNNKEKVIKATKFIALLIFICVYVPGVDASWSIEEELRSYIENNYPWNDFELRGINVTGTLKNEPPEKIIVEKGPIGKAVFSLWYESGERVFVKAYMRAFDWVIKSKRPFRRGHVLQEDELYREKMDVRKIPNNAIKDMRDVIGKTLKRSISTNIAISERMLENTDMVKKGSMVVLIINSGALSIKAEGKTKERGFVGSSVTAVNLSSQREVRGILIDENTVEVML